MQGYRLVKRKWLKSVFDGEGARLYGGRWNSKGKACVYLASAESLAILEVMVHLNDYRLLEDYALLQVAFHDDDLMRLPEDGRPDDWMATLCRFRFTGFDAQLAPALRRRVRVMRLLRQF